LNALARIKPPQEVVKQLREVDATLDKDHRTAQSCGELVGVGVKQRPKAMLHADGALGRSSAAHPAQFAEGLC